MKKGSKSVALGRKQSCSGVDPTPDMLQKINSFSLADLTADQIYVRKFLLAHNGVDRDRERFSESILEDFAKTLPGKSFLFAHDRRGYLPLGLFFDSSTEEITPEQFKAMTGEDIRLPEDATMAKVLWAHMYALKSENRQDLMENIDAGIYRHVSIGFAAADLAQIKGEFNETLYWEYASPGEAMEGSLVWLGAQPGATAQKQAENDTGEETMDKQFIKRMKTLTGKDIPADASIIVVGDSVESAMKELQSKIDTLQVTVDKNAEMATAGKAFVDGLVEDYARMKAALGECEESPEAAETVKSFARTMPLDFLKQEVKHLEQRMEQKFPAGGQLQGDEGQGRTNEDLTKDAKNPLIPE